MTALVVARVTPRNSEKMGEYAAAAAKTLSPFGGEIIHRGKFEKTLLGEADPHGLGVMRFPSTQAASDWFASPDYQDIAPLREEAAEMTFVVYDLAD